MSPETEKNIHRSPLNEPFKSVQPLNVLVAVAGWGILILRKRGMKKENMWADTPSFGSLGRPEGQDEGRRQAIG